MRKDAPGHVAGFSLVETSIVLAVVAILAGLALPGFQETLRRQRAATAMHQVATQLSQARNTAIARRVPVTACPSLGDGRCRTEPDWSAGWLLYLDPTRSPQPRGNDDILRQERQPLHESVRVSATAGRMRVRYQPDGRSGGNNLTLRVCSAGVLRGEVIVNNVGRVRTRRPAYEAPCPPA
ncbi:GspH/FimT family pseudopilin [Pseudoxanthomonas kaohsiungensis]|uniref:Type II secretion system protein H n=1 Tax=Pseudoxanthomonas kaohsiungensis TaxID=283923 RepID=A0ABW3LU67_9GAMM|nr:Tfp pilus assembly protein FimT/FimU [Pseudoxanthomonas kaohsiungensis]KAF1703579.1 pilus assembly protein [Pseudoxanthomonas kaohsiungensis]